MSELTDEQALSYIESIVNQQRALKHLEDLVRWVKNSLTDLRAQQANADTLAARIAQLAVQEQDSLARAEGALRQQQQTESEAATVMARLLAERRDAEAELSRLADETRRLSAQRDQLLHDLAEARARTDGEAKRATELQLQQQELEGRVRELRHALREIAQQAST